MTNTNTHHVHNTALLFILIAPFTILWYAVYVFNPNNAGDIFLYVLQIIADVIAITTVGTLWLTILLHILRPENEHIDRVKQHEWVKKMKPTVDVLIPVASESLKTIEKTVKHALAMDYPHKTFVLDDGHSLFVKKLIEDLGAIYCSRNPVGKKFAKSGNLNFGLSQSESDFFAVFDADHVPKKEFLVSLLPFFEDKNVALVQTPQFYTNLDNFIASGTAQAQEIFYKYVQPAKNSYNAAFCVGTNMIYRRSAIDKIGGITLRDHSEDVWTTINLHEKRYKSIFYNKVLAEGRAPETIGSFFRQQNRWARGGFSLFFTHNPLFVEGLTLDQRIQYFFSNLHYFSGFAILIYFLLPIIYLLFNHHPMDISHNRGWIFHYIPYFLTIYFLPLFLLGSIKISTISVSMASFSPYLKAFFSILLKNKYKWVSTESASRQKGTYIMFYIWPHVFILFLSLFSIIVGWYNPLDTATTIITSFWVFINSYILFIFIRNGLVTSI